MHHYSGNILSNIRILFKMSNMYQYIGIIISEKVKTRLIA